MKALLKSTLMVIVMLGFLSANICMAAGYEPVYTSNGIIVEDNRDSSKHVNAWSALKEAVFLERAPDVLDKMAVTLRSLVRQLGVGTSN